MKFLPFICISILFFSCNGSKPKGSNETEQTVNDTNQNVTTQMDTKTEIPESELLYKEDVEDLEIDETKTLRIPIATGEVYFAEMLNAPVLTSDYVQQHDTLKFVFSPFYGIDGEINFVPIYTKNMDDSALVVTEKFCQQMLFGSGLNDPTDFEEFEMYCNEPVLLERNFRGELRTLNIYQFPSAIPKEIVSKAITFVDSLNQNIPEESKFFTDEYYTQVIFDVTYKNTHKVLVFTYTHDSV